MPALGQRPVDVIHPERPGSLGVAEDDEALEVVLGHSPSLRRRGGTAYGGVGAQPTAASGQVGITGLVSAAAGSGGVG
ncbi:hypothetical protein GCM10028789_30620 [Sinomonas halotolerans]